VTRPSRTTRRPEATVPSPQPSPPTTGEREPEIAPSPFAAFLGHAAFAILIAIVVARCLMLESIRSVGDFAAGPGSGTQGPGAATSIVLDWLSFVPILLTLGRRILDPTRPLRFAWSHWLLAALAVWSLASVAWADDKFLALISAARIAGGAALFWSTSQLVTRWDQLRVIVGIVVGVLLVNVAQGVIYQNFELAELKQYWTANRAQILESHGWREGDYTAQRFEMKILAGEMMNFSISANVLGAVVVTAALAAFAAGMQRLEDKDDHGWVGALFLAALGSVYVLTHTGSKASWAALALGIALLVSWRITRGWLARNRKLAFALAVAVVALGIAGVITLGLARGGLPSDSLNFRWRYWIGSWWLFLERPFTGVGWGNFGDAYLRHRLPEATEEVQDPHSFLVRWATELGLVGLGLGVAWLFAWAWRATTFNWKAAVPAASAVPSERHGVTPSTGRMPITRVLLACVPMLALLLVCTIDFTGDSNYAVLETFRRCVHVALIALAIGLVCLGKRQSRDEPFYVDDRPAPWLAAGLFVGVVVMLVQSTIDIALFQPGPWVLVVVMMGTLVGIVPDQVQTPLGMNGRILRWPSVVVFSITAAVWIVIGGGVAARVILAEYFKSASDRETARGNVYAASSSVRDAIDITPVSNWEYVETQIDAMQRHAASPKGQDFQFNWPVVYGELVDTAPRHPMNWLTRSRWLSSQKTVSPADAQQSIDDFGRAVALNPNDVDLRIEYADLLERFGRQISAAEQLEAALKIDDKLDPKEPERLKLRSPGKYEAIRKRISVLRAATTVPS
jgi:O-antigen ligase